MRDERAARRRRITVAIAGLAVAAVSTTAAAPVRAQEPVPPADAPAPGSAYVDGAEIRVTRDERVRVKVRCVVSEVACKGSVRVVSGKPLSPGRGKARRILTIAEGSYGEIAPGQSLTVTLPVRPEAAARVRKYRKTPVVWHMLLPDGREQYIFIGHMATLVSNALR